MRVLFGMSGVKMSEIEGVTECIFECECECVAVFTDVDAKAGLQAGKYFTHFEIVRVMKLAACMLERAQSCTKSDYLR